MRLLLAPLLTKHDTTTTTNNHHYTVFTIPTTIFHRPTRSLDARPVWRIIGPFRPFRFFFWTVSWLACRGPVCHHSQGQGEKVGLLDIDAVDPVLVFFLNFLSPFFSEGRFLSLALQNGQSAGGKTNTHPKDKKGLDPLRPLPALTSLA